MMYRTPSYAQGVYDCFFFEKNLQGDIIAVYNDSGTKVVSYTYDAWGNVTTTYHSGGASTGARYNPFRYRGYYHDAETGWYYLESRYYNPSWGRFLNSDSLLISDLLGYNLFIYCGNNPVSRHDRDGRTFGENGEEEDEFMLDGAAGGSGWGKGEKTQNNKSAGGSSRSGSGKSSYSMGRNSGGGWSVGRGTSSKAPANSITGKGSQNPTVRVAAQRGQQVHKEWDYGPGVAKEQLIAPGCRVDGINRNDHLIYELKPNNPQAISRGMRQLDDISTLRQKPTVESGLAYL